MNLTTTAGLVKKFAFIPVLILLVIILAVLIFLRFGNQNKTALPIPQAPQFETLPGKASGFNLQNLEEVKDTPQSMPVYKTDQGKNFLLEAQNLASALKFTDEATSIRDINLGEGKIYSSSVGSLIIYSEIITYQKNITNSPPPPPKLSVSDLEEQARTFLATIGFSGQNPKVSFSKITGEDIVQAENEQGADFVKFSFPYSAGNFPVISPSNDMSITYNFGGDLIYSTLRNFKIASTLGEYPVIPLGDAVKELLSSKASLVKVTGSKEDIASTRNLQEISINSAYLAYYLPSSPTEVVQPVWVFEGTTNVDESSAEVIYSIPAIKGSL